MERLESEKRERKVVEDDGKFEWESESDWRASELSRRICSRLDRRSSIERCFLWRAESRAWFEVERASSFSIVLARESAREDGGRGS